MFWSSWYLRENSFKTSQDESFGLSPACENLSPNEYKVCMCLIDRFNGNHVVTLTNLTLVSFITTSALAEVVGAYTLTA